MRLTVIFPFSSTGTIHQVHHTLRTRQRMRIARARSLQRIDELKLAKRFPLFNGKDVSVAKDDTCFR